MPNESLNVTRLPGRKRMSLSLEMGGVIEPLAYFVSDLAADVFIDIVKRGLRWSEENSDAD